MRPLSVLHVVPSYLPATRYGGPIYSVHGLCAALVRRGHQIHVFTTNVDGPGVSQVPVGQPIHLDGVKVTYFAVGVGRRLYRSPDMGRALQQQITSFDIVHLHSVFLWPTTVAAAVARRAGVPFVLAPRGMLVPELIAAKSHLVKTAWIELFERRNVATAAAVHVTSELEARNIERLGLHAARIETIPNGIDIRGVAKREVGATPRSEAVIVCVGRLSWKKGLDRMIVAMSYLPQARLVVAGNDDENYLPRLREIATRIGVTERVDFIGPVHGEAKWRVLADADVFALPSYSENFGIAVLEAMAAGLPVVVTREVGLAAEVAACNAGLVADGEPQQFAAALGHLLGDPALRQRMGRNGRTAAAARYSWEAVAARCEGLYNQIVPYAPPEVNSDA